MTDPRDSDALVTLTELARTATKPPTDAELQRGLKQLLARVAETPRRPIRRGRWFVTALGFAVVLGAVVMLWQRPSEPREPIAVSLVEGGKLLEGGYLSESGRDGVKLSFSDGSEFSLLPGARGRLRAVRAEGADFAVESGEARFRITPAPDRHWTVEAGPFRVAVKGTEFTVSWDPSAEEFYVTLSQGRVLVSGPIVGEDLALRPGQKLSVSLPKAETVIAEARPASTAAADSASPAATPLASVALGVATTPDTPAARTSTPPSARQPRNWKEAMANGEWDRILEDAERAGIKATVETVSSDELLALTDAARYRRRSEVARTALLAQRRRFPESSRSVDAMFLLGRVDESSSAATAITWYDRYLAEAPAGTYSAEALGRKMILTRKLHGDTRARDIAEEYLRRFPEGSYAGTARALLREP
jgi:ferric-dicitrate binding protein FerR (iron transport regulator)